MKVRNIISHLVVFTAILSLSAGCGAGRRISGPSLSGDYISMYPDSSRNVHIETTLNVPSDYCKRRSRLIILPHFMQGDSVKMVLPSVVLDSPIYSKKVRRLAVLEGYQDKYAGRAMVVRPGKELSLPCSLDVRIPENVTGGHLELSFAREGCGKCSPLGALPIASYTDPSTLFDFNQPEKSIPEPEVRTGSGTALIMFDINRSEIDLSRGNNRAEMEKILGALSPVVRDSVAMLENVTVFGFASPDGSLPFNTRLAYKRASSARDWLTSSLGINEEDMKCFSVDSRPEGWEPVWNAMQAAGSSGTEEIRKILDRYSDAGDDTQEFYIRKSPYWPEIRSKYLQKDRKVEYTYTYRYQDFADGESVSARDSLYRMFNLGLDKARQGDYEEALVLFRPFGGVNAAIMALCTGRNEEAQEIMQASDDRSPLAEYCRALAAARLGNIAVCYKHLVEACRDEALKERAINEADFIRLHLDKALLKEN